MCVWRGEGKRGNQKQKRLCLIWYSIAHSMYFILLSFFKVLIIELHLPELICTWSITIMYIFIYYTHVHVHICVYGLKWYLSIWYATLFCNLYSQLTLNSEGGRAVSPSQVSLSTSPPPSMHQPGLIEVEKEQRPSTRRSPMLKSYSQDTAGSRTEATFKVGGSLRDWMSACVADIAAVMTLRVSRYSTQEVLYHEGSLHVQYYKIWYV